MGKARVIGLNALTFPPRREDGYRPVAHPNIYLSPSLSEPYSSALSGLTIDSRRACFLVKWANDISMVAEKASNSAGLHIPLRVRCVKCALLLHTPTPYLKYNKFDTLRGS